ncbi:lambda family phage portal protein [Rhodopseudomonas faecalis]|uniref:Lambda family phage portal protein n=1 Tax=Rhodopseudomonas faecalis TaxID=99655 RepID=A0A318TZF8_9BRAD|nr:phage portal protein [Rhodopseudomonas faecalis]PYF05029.1 lambda family phage portal protein [Rhodopseudomonas faecalis]
MSSKATALFDQYGDPIRSVGNRGRVMAGGFRGASYSDPDLAAWTPNLYSAHAAYMGDRNPLAARVHDLVRNDGWTAGGVTRVVDTIIGAQFRLTSKPIARVLGIDDDAADELANNIEAEFSMWADDPDCYCDAGRRNSFTGNLGLMFRHRLVDGEALAKIEWLPGRGGIYSTAVKVIDPDRLSNPHNQIDTVSLRMGIALGAHEEPIGYHIRMAHPGDAGVYNPNIWRWEYFARETTFGRRMMVHAFEAERAGQVRGISVLAPIIKKLRMLGRYDEAELQAAVINAVMAAIVESPFDHEQFAAALAGGDELSSYQTQRLGYYDASPINLGGAKMAFAFPGEKVTLTKPSHPNSVFEHFVRASLRNVASALGMSYEQLSMDWGQVNYSSARAALLEVWRGYTARRGHFVAQAVQPIYAAWLEEAIDKGRVKLPSGAPDFYAAKAAYCAARWIGPGRGWVDPLKEAQASAFRIASGLSTLERETAEAAGEDYLENLRQTARERKEIASLGMDWKQFRSQPGGAAPPADDDEEPRPKKKRKEPA